MYEIDNNYNIDDECYSVYRKHKFYTCPICEGNGSFVCKGHEILCKNCCGSGKIHNPRKSVMEVYKCKITRIIAYVNESSSLHIKYRVKGIGDAPVKAIKSRDKMEALVFATKEEAELYCKAVNEVENN